MRRFGLFMGLLSLALGAGFNPSLAQDKDPTVIKLPDGTVVFYSSNVEDPIPKLEGVKLTVKEYRKLLDQADQWRKAKANTAPVPPSECHVAGKAVTRGDRPIAELILTYQVRTLVPRTLVPLGTSKTFLTSAKLDADQRPVLVATEEGLSAILETPGDHTLVLTADAPIHTRAGQREIGFEIGLPKAAISTVTMASPFPATSKNETISVGVRGPDATVKPGEIRRTPHTPAALSQTPVALGPVDWLELSWPAIATGKTNTFGPIVAETTTAVRIGEAQTEITATIPFKGEANREWQVVLPANTTATLTAPGEPALPLTPPSESKSPWLVRLPKAGDWTLTATTTQDRKGSTIPVGPYAVVGAVQNAGVIRIWSPVNIRPQVKHGPEVRKVDLAADEAMALAYSSIPANAKETPLVVVTPTAAPGFVVIKPTYKLRLTTTGWRFRADIRVSPVRTEMDRVIVEVPTSWPGVDVGPSTVVEAVQADAWPANTKRLTVRLLAPRKDAFDLSLDVNFPPGTDPRTMDFNLPKFTNASERDAEVTVQVPEGFDVQAKITPRATATGTAVAGDLSPPDGSSKATGITVVTGRAAGGVDRVAVVWSPYRPELNAECKIDVSETNRQFTVSQTIRYKVPVNFPKMLKLRGPTGLVGLRANVSVTSSTPGEWTLTPPTDRTNDWTLTLSFAVAHINDATTLAVPILWPEDTTTTTATVKIWAPRGRQFGNIVGPWREVPPQPSAERDSLPRLTLLGERGKDAPIPKLSLEVSPTNEGPKATVVAERVLVQVWTEKSMKTRIRYAITRWSSEPLELEAPTGSVEYFLDGKRVEPVVVGSVVRIPMPEPRPNRSPVVLDIRNQDNSEKTLNTVAIPEIRGASFTTVKWAMLTPPSQVSLDLGSPVTVLQRWGMQHRLPGLVATESASTMDAWLIGQTTSDKTATDMDTVLSATGPGPLRVVKLPRIVWILVCSAIAILTLTLVVLGRSPWLGAGTLLILTTGLGYFLPHAAGQALAAASPGLGVGILVLSARFIARTIAHRRRVNLPAFRRTLGDSTMLAPASPTGA